MNNLKWNIIPEIKYSKVSCPICKLPCGQKAECYKLDIGKVKNFQRSYQAPNGQILPIFSPNCYFRQKNLWRIDINYILSLSLFEYLSSISGIEDVSCIGKYSCIINIGLLFDEIQIKKETNYRIKDFAKRMLLIEQQVINKKAKKDRPIGVKMPNGNICMDKDLSIEAINHVCSALVGSEKVFEDSLKSLSQVPIIDIEKKGK